MSDGPETYPADIETPQYLDENFTEESAEPKVIVVRVDPYEEEISAVEVEIPADSVLYVNDDKSFLYNTTWRGSNRIDNFDSSINRYDTHFISRKSVKSSKKVKIHRCNDCDRSFSTKFSLFQHSRRHTSRSKSDIQCDPSEPIDDSNKIVVERVESVEKTQPDDESIRLQPNVVHYGTDSENIVPEVAQSEEIATPHFIIENVRTASPDSEQLQNDPSESSSVKYSKKGRRVKHKASRNVNSTVVDASKLCETQFQNEKPSKGQSPAKNQKKEGKSVKAATKGRRIKNKTPAKSVVTWKNKKRLEINRSDDFNTCTEPSGQTYHVCPECGRVFNRKLALVTHMKEHSLTAKEETEINAKDMVAESSEKKNGPSTKKGAKKPSILSPKPAFKGFEVVPVSSFNPASYNDKDKLNMKNGEDIEMEPGYRKNRGKSKTIGSSDITHMDISTKTTDNDQAVNDENTIEEKVIKRRGRPKLKKTSAVPIDSNNGNISNFDAAIEIVPEKRRGRPKKIKTPLGPNADDSNDKKEAPTEKRGRGRPRLNKTEKSPVISDSHERQKDSNNYDAEGVEEPEQKRRGRKRKIETSTNVDHVSQNQKNVDNFVNHQNRGDCLTCTECGQHFEERFELVKHFESHTWTNKRRLRSASDAINWDSIINIKDESNDIDSQSNPNIDYHDEMSLPTIDITQVEQSIVGDKQVYVVKREKRKYVRSMDKSNLVCSICKLRFTVKKLLNEHYVVEHDMKPHLCTICLRRFTLECNLRSHVAMHFNKKPHVCHVCFRGFGTKSNLCRHFLTHQEHPKFACSICGVTFTRKENMQMHEKRHLGGAKFKCEYCPAKFVYMSRLKVHSVVHTGVRAFKCKLCGKSYKTMANLVCHQLLHSGARNFKCDLCSKTFLTKGSIVTHIRWSHNNENPFECQICMRRLPTKSQLMRHEEIHSEKRKYKCNSCGKRFPTKGALTAHLSHHEIGPLRECAKCKQTFTRRYDWIKHRRSYLKLGRCEVARKMLKMYKQQE